MSVCSRCGGTKTIEVYMRGGKKREFPCPSCPQPPNRQAS